MKNVIINTFNAERNYFETMIEGFRGTFTNLDRAAFLKAVMTELISESGIALFEKEVEGYDAESALPCVVEEIAKNVSFANRSTGKVFASLEADRQARKELYNIIK